MTRVGRLVAWLGLLGVVAAVTPHDAAAHCRPAAPAHQAHHDHDTSKDTGDHGQCPHCPPAECRRHAACAEGLDSLGVSTAAVPAPALPAVAVRPAAVHPSRDDTAPPTPPPQTLL